MKQKMIYISDEIFEQLKGSENASALVEKLCREHFQSTEVKTMTPEQRSKRIAILEIELEAMRKKKEVENAPSN
jgi:predicted aspartyl protease